MNGMAELSQENRGGTVKSNGKLKNPQILTAEKSKNPGCSTRQLWSAAAEGSFVCAKK